MAGGVVVVILGDDVGNSSEVWSWLAAEPADHPTYYWRDLLRAWRS